MKLLLCLTLFVCSPVIFSQSSNCNCCSEKHRAFDFWVGEWHVTNAKGKFAGTNRIEKFQDNCLIRENWTSSNGGYSGTSNNIYNPKINQWEQIWIDNQGKTLHLKGNRIGNQMILKSNEELDKDGQTYFNRITWTANADGTVRQLWEVIKNNNDIYVAFDGLYKRN